MYVWRNIKAHSCNHCCCKKASSIPYSECVFVPLLIQHAQRMQHIVLSVACLASPYLHTLTNGKIFGRKNVIDINNVLISSTILSEIFLSLMKN